MLVLSSETPSRLKGIETSSADVCDLKPTLEFRNAFPVEGNRNASRSGLSCAKPSFKFRNAFPVEGNRN